MAIPKKVRSVYKKYAPKNITLEQFAQMVEQDPKLLDDIGGKFSTFNPKLAKAMNRASFFSTKSKDELREVLAHYTFTADALRSRGHAYGRIFWKVISSNENILKSVWVFETLDKQQQQDLAIDIIKSVNKHFNIKDEIEIEVVKEIAEDDVMGFYNPDLKRIILEETNDVRRFMEILSHEYNHFIDDCHPDFGALGTQVSVAARKAYGSSYSGGKYVNPTEVSSHAVGIDVAYYVKEMLLKQAEKNPDLYIKTLQQAIDHLKIKFASLQFKETKLKQKYESLKNKKIDERYPDFYNLPKEQQDKIISNIERNLRLRIVGYIYKRHHKKYLNSYINILNVLEQKLENFIEKYEVNKVVLNKEQDWHR